RVVDASDATTFVILATAGQRLSSLYSATRKDFATPLGTVETDRMFVASLTRNLAAMPGGAEVQLAADELAHRNEHAIEFQAVLLQYILAERRPFKIVPILVGSFHELLESRQSPSETPAVKAMVAALRKTIEAQSGQVCLICAGDLSHIGQRYGDREFLNA